MHSCCCHTDASSALLLRHHSATGSMDSYLGIRTTVSSLRALAGSYGYRQHKVGEQLKRKQKEKEAPVVDTRSCEKVTGGRYC